MIKERITIPTYITLSRFILVTVFAYLFIIEKYIASLIILIIAGISDFVDGWVARNFNMRSRLGSMLDPLADKYLMMISFLILSTLGRIPWELTGLILFRDFGIVLASAIYTLILKIRLYYKPTRLSKWATTFQILTLSFTYCLLVMEKTGFLLEHSFYRWIHIGQTINIYLAVIFTVITYFQYIFIGYKFYRYGERVRH